MLKNHWFYHYFLKGQESEEHSRTASEGARRTVFWSKKLQKRSKKETNEPLDMKGKYDAYMFGLGGPRSENVEKQMVFKGCLRGAKGQEHSKSRNKSMRKWLLVEKATKKGAKQRTNEPLDMRWQV